jgi:DNA transformation protein
MNSRWTDLKNTGKQTTRRLQEAGIHSEEALRTEGALGAHARIRRRYPDESLPICYGLYAFVADKG